MVNHETVYISLGGLFLVLIVLIIVYKRIKAQSYRFCQKGGSKVTQSAVTTAPAETHGICESKSHMKKDYNCITMYHTDEKNTIGKNEVITFHNNSDGTYFENTFETKNKKKNYKFKNVYTHFVKNKNNEFMPEWLSSKETTISKDGKKEDTKWEGLQCKYIENKEANKWCRQAQFQFHVTGKDVSSEHDVFDCDKVFNTNSEKHEAMLCQGITNSHKKNELCLDMHTHLLTMPKINMKKHNMITWTNGKLHTALACKEK